MSTQVVPLSERASDVPLKPTLEERLATSVIRLFSISLGTTLLLAALLAAVDAYFIFSGIIEPAERLITANVVMALIGATIIELGVAMGTIVSTVFDRKALEKSSD